MTTHTEEAMLKTWRVPEIVDENSAEVKNRRYAEEQALLKEYDVPSTEEDLTGLQEVSAHAQVFNYGLQKTVQGFDVAGERVLEFLKLRPKGTADARQARYEGINADTEQWKRRMNEKGASGLGVTQFAGEVAPYLAMPVPGSVAWGAARAGQAGIGMGIARVAGRVPGGAAQGSVVGFTQMMRDDKERLQATLMGAAFGGGAAGLIQMATFFRPSNLRAWWTGLGNKLESDTAKKAYLLEQEHGAWFTLAEKTGDPWLESLAVAARTGNKGLQLGRKLDIDRLTHSIGVLRKELANFTHPDKIKLGSRIKEAYTNIVNGVRKGRSNAWDATMAEAHKLSDGARFIPITKLRDDIQRLIDELDTPLNNTVSGKQALKFLKEQMSALTNAGRLTAKEAQLEMKKYTAAAKSKVMLFDDAGTYSQDVAHSLKTALRQDLDGLAPLVDPAYRSSASLVLKARSDWRAASQELDAFRNTIIGQFVKKGPNVKPTAAEDYVTALVKSEAKPSEVEAVLNILRDHDPAIINAIKGSYLMQRFASATERNVNLPANVPSLDYGKWMKGLDMDDMLYKKLFNTVERERHRSIYKMFDRLAGTDLRLGTTNVAADAGNIARNVTGLATGGAQTLIFTMGGIAKWVTSRFATKVMLDPKAAAALEVLVTAGKTSAKGYVAPGVKYAPAVVAEAYLTIMEIANDEGLEMPMDVPPELNPLINPDLQDE